MYRRLAQQQLTVWVGLQALFLFIYISILVYFLVLPLCTVGGLAAAEVWVVVQSMFLFYLVFIVLNHISLYMVQTTILLFCIHILCITSLCLLF